MPPKPNWYQWNGNHRNQIPNRFLFCRKIPILNQILTLNVLKMPIKYQENTKKFGTEIPNTDLVLVFSWYRYQIFGYRLTSLFLTQFSYIQTTARIDHALYLRQKLTIHAMFIFVCYKTFIFNTYLTDNRRHSSGCNLMWSIIGIHWSCPETVSSGIWMTRRKITSPD